MKLLLLVVGFSLGFFVAKLVPASRPSEGTQKEDAQPVAKSEREVAPKALSAKPEVATQSTTEEPSKPLIEPRSESKVVDSPPMETQPPSRRWVSSESALAQVRGRSEIGDFLQKVRIDNFATELALARPIPQGDPTVELLNGNFMGSMSPQDGSAPFNIFLQAQVQTQSGALNGRLSVRLSRDGRTFSRSSSNGDIKNVQKLNGSNVSVIVTTGDYHFQLYYFPQFESFEGNCYRQDRPGSAQIAGIVHLERV